MVQNEYPALQLGARDWRGVLGVEPLRDGLDVLVGVKPSATHGVDHEHDFGGFRVLLGVEVDIKLGQIRINWV